MKKSDIYEVAVKLLGIFLFVTHFSTVFRSIFEVIQATNNMHNGTSGYPIGLVEIYILFEVLIILFSLLLIFKSSYFVYKISSADDYEENIKLFAENKTIYEIALIIIGGINIIWALPDFVDKLYWYIFYKRNQFSIRSYDEEVLIVFGIKLFLGIIIIAYAKPIAAYFGRNIIVTSKNDE